MLTYTYTYIHMFKYTYIYIDNIASGFGVDRNVTEEMVNEVSKLAVVSLSSQAFVPLQYAVKTSVSPVRAQIIPVKCGPSGACEPVIEEEMVDICRNSYIYSYICSYIYSYTYSYTYVGAPLLEILPHQISVSKLYEMISKRLQIYTTSALSPEEATRLNEKKRRYASRSINTGLLSLDAPLPEFSTALLPSTNDETLGGGT